MADPPAYPDTADDAGVGPGPGSTSSTPRWVKVFGLVAVILVVLFVIAILIAGGRHGPSRHTPSGNTGGHTPPATVAEHGVQQP